MIKLALFIFSLLVFGMCTNSNDYDSSKNNSTNEEYTFTHDTTKVNTLLDCASINRRKDLVLAKLCVDSAILIAKQITFEKGLVKAFKLKGNIVSRDGLLEDELAFYNKSLSIADSIAYKEGILSAKLSIANVYKNLGRNLESIKIYEEILLDLKGATRISFLINLASAYNKIGRLEKAQSLYIEAEQLTLKHKDSIGNKTNRILSAIYSGLGNIFKNINDGDSAIQYFQKSLQLIPENDNSIFTLQNNIASAYKELDHLDSAKYFYLQSINSDKATLTTKSYAYIGICDVLMEEENYQNTRRYANEGLTAIKNTSLEKNKSMLIAFISESYLKQKDFDKAILFGNKAKEGVKKSGLFKQLIQVEEILIGAKLGKEKNLLFHDFEDYSTLKDSFRLAELGKEIQNLHIKYETEKTEKELARSNKAKEIEAAKAKTNLLLFVSSLFACLFIVVIFFREQKRKKEQIALKNEAIEAKKREEVLKENIAKLREADNHRTDNAFERTLSELKNQANTTNVYATKVAINKARSLIHTSKIIHNILIKHDEEQEINVPISEILKNLCAILEAIFVDKKIRTNVNCEESLLINQRVIQPLFLIIEELFTNAWKHAFINQPSPKIDLALKNIGDDFIRLSYKDNGVGLPHNIDFQKEDSQGLELIKHFSRSIGGEISMDSSDGLKFEINFDKDKMLV